MDEHLTPDTISNTFDDVVRMYNDGSDEIKVTIVDKCLYILKSTLPEGKCIELLNEIEKRVIR